MRKPRLTFLYSITILSAFSGFAEEQDVKSTGPKSTDAKPTHFDSVQISTVDDQKVTLPQADKKATVLLFLSCDCPIANAFAPEIGRIYDAYKDKGIAFFRVYPDVAQDAENIKQHAVDYSHKSPAIRDAEQVLVKNSGARITPEAVVLLPDGTIVYRGRINDLYTDIGKRRRQATTADLRDTLDDVLAGKPVKMSETKAFGCYIPLEFEEEQEDAPAPKDK